MQSVYFPYILANCLEDPTFASICERVCIRSVSDAWLVYQLIPYYSQKYRNRQILPNQPISEFIDDMTERIIVQQHGCHFGLLNQIVASINTAFANYVDGEFMRNEYILSEPLTTDLCNMFAQHPEAALLDALALQFVANLMVLEMELKPARIAHYVAICKMQNNDYIRKTLQCREQIFNSLHTHATDELSINPYIYASQLDILQRSKLNTTVVNNFSIIYTCPKCKQKMCRFQPVQTAASDEETRAKVTCYNESCGNTWIH